MPPKYIVCSITAAWPVKRFISCTLEESSTSARSFGSLTSRRPRTEPFFLRTPFGVALRRVSLATASSFPSIYPLWHTAGVLSRSTFVLEARPYNGSDDRPGSWVALLQPVFGSIPHRGHGSVPPEA